MDYIDNLLLLIYFPYKNRDGELFRPILDFLRTGQMKVPKFIDAKRLIEEAMFYRINVPQILNDVIEPITVAPSPTADFLPLRGGVYVEEPRHDSATIIYVSLPNALFLTVCDII